MIGRRWVTGVLSVVIASSPAACAWPGAAVSGPGREGSATPKVASSRTGQGIDETTVRKRLEALAGVRSVELRTVDGFDTGHYLLANLEVASRDRAAAVRLVDAASALMWRVAQTPDKRVRVLVRTDTGTFTVADDGDLDPDIRTHYRDAMTRRYGAWPGRGVKASP